MNHLLRIADLQPGDLRLLLDQSRRFRANPTHAAGDLAHQTVVLYFNHPSTRTRISMATAVVRLGGTPLTVGPDELQLGRGETIEDTARTISRYARAFVIRTGPDRDVERFAAAASIPVINALTDLHHPCQALADLMTLEDHAGPLDQITVAYVGDGNNVCHSLMEGLALAGSTLRIATPEGYEPDAALLAHAAAVAERQGGSVHLTHDPMEAVAGADAVYTDVWLSMGHDPSEREARLTAFRPFQVDAALMGHAAPGARFLHCLPDHRGQEVTAEVVDGPASVVFDQAENRLHTATAVLQALVMRRLSGSSAGSTPAMRTSS